MTKNARVLSGFLFLLCSLRLAATVPSDYTEGVSFSETLTAFGGGLTMTVIDENGGASTSVNANAGESSINTGWLKPGKSYTFTVNGAVVGNYNNSTHEYTYSGGYSVNYTAPKGYSVYINNVLSDGWSVAYNSMSYSPTLPVNDTYTIVLQPLADASRADAGSFSGIDLGKAITWEIGLGGLRTGRSAGRIVFKQLDLTTSPASRARLFYAAPANNGQIQVVYDSNGYLSQVGVPQTVAILTDNSGGYVVSFFNTTDVTWNGSSYTPNSGANPWRTIQVQAPSSSQLQITETDQTSTPSLVRVSLLSLTSGSVSSGTYVWQLQEGNGATWLRTTTHASVPVAGSSPAVRTDTVTVTDQNNNVATKTAYTYTTEPWGEEVTSIVGDPGTGNSNATTKFTYFTNNNSPGNYRKIQSTTDPSGNWVSYSYYDDWNRRGQLAIESHPFGNTPAIQQTAATTVGYSTSYDYSADYSGRYRNESSRKYYINNGQNVQVGQRSTTVTLVPANSFTQLQINDYCSASSSIQSTTQIMFPIGGNSDLYNQVLLNQRPDSTEDSFGYYLGTYSGGVFTVSSTGVLFFESIAVHGSATASAGDAYSNFQGQSIATVYVVPNSSTMELIIRNPAGQIVHKETRVYQGSGQFTAMATEDYVYDGAGRLTDDTPSNNAVVHNNYVNGQITSTIDAYGIETDYSYDALGRIATSTKKGVAANGTYAAQGSIVTTYSYDAASRSTATVVSGGGLVVSKKASYDKGGRTTSEATYTDNAAYTQTTSYSYNFPAGQGETKTTTLPGPNSPTTIVANNLDGSVASLTGTGDINKYYTYSLDNSTGNRVVTLAYGYAASPAKTTTKLDWLGRTISFQVPAWGGASATESYSYAPSTGQLTSVSKTGFANLLYQYDPLGRPYRMGLDVNNNGTLDLQSSDRIAESDNSFWNDGSGHWYLHTHNLLYANPSSATGTVLSDRYELVSNLNSTTQAQSLVTDRYGNTTTTTVAVNRATQSMTATTQTPWSSVNAINSYYNGLLMSSQDSASVTVAYGYDAIGRVTQSTDPRSGTTTTAYYQGTNLVSTVTDPQGTVQSNYNYDTAGRVSTVADAFQKVARYDYNARGQLQHEWGDTTYPVEHDYDIYGREKYLQTFAGSSASFAGSSATSWPSSPGTPAWTYWNYDEATGLLANKYDAANLTSTGALISNPLSVAYTYTAAGQLLTKTNKRLNTDSYSYDPNTGELTKITYSDQSTDQFTYTRWGALLSVNNSSLGTRNFNYNVSGTLELQSLDLGSYFGSLRITRTYDNVTVKGRPTGYDLGTASQPTSYQNVGWNYQSDGRLSSVAAGGQTFSYNYVPNSHLVSSVADSALTYAQGVGYDPYHDWTTSRTTTWGSTPVTMGKFTYTPDLIGRYQNVTKSGSLFAQYGNGNDSLTTSYSYDAISQLVGEQTVVSSTGTMLPGRNNGNATTPGFTYDNLGNRVKSAHNGNTTNYSLYPNNLNQYETRTVPGIFDVSGAAATGATVTVNGIGTNVSRSGMYFFDPFSLNNNSQDVFANLSVSDGTNTTSTPAYLPGTGDVLTYDLDGNLTYDGRWTYTYDGENRLIAMQTSSTAVAAGTPKQQILNTYDYLNRRVRKVLSNWNNGTSAWVTQYDTQFIYQGDSLIAEVNSATGMLLKSYYWGLDLQGSLNGSGGVGGLLMIQGTFANGGTGGSDSNTLLPIHDALGNVCGLLNAVAATGASGYMYPAGSIVAGYEYDSFGQTLRESGIYGASNPVQWSTRYTDVESGLVYYGSRFYNPGLGRFLNFDPIGESGGYNLYGFCGNNGACAFDVLGMDPTWSFSSNAGSWSFQPATDTYGLLENLVTQVAGASKPDGGLTIQIEFSMTGSLKYWVISNVSGVANSYASEIGVEAGAPWTVTLRGPWGSKEIDTPNYHPVIPVTNPIETGGSNTGGGSGVTTGQPNPTPQPAPSGVANNSKAFVAGATNAVDQSAYVLATSGRDSNSALARAMGDSGERLSAAPSMGWFMEGIVSGLSGPGRDELELSSQKALVNFVNNVAYNATIGTALSAKYYWDAGNEAYLNGDTTMMYLDTLRAMGDVASLGLLSTGAFNGIQGSFAFAAETAGADVYSVAYKMRLAPESYPGLSRAAHFQEANESLLSAMEGDAQFAQSMEDLGVSLERTPTGLAPRQSPAGWTWHHADGLGEMDLVPRYQHTPGSSFWPILHPDGHGGYYIWGK